MLEIDGIKVHYPAGEEKLARALKPQILEFREALRTELVPELANIEDTLNGEDNRQLLIWALGMDLPKTTALTPAHYEKWIRETIEQVKVHMTPVQAWATDIESLHLWSVDELKSFETDPGVYVFPEASWQIPNAGEAKTNTDAEAENPASATVRMPIRAGGYGAEGLPLELVSDAAMRLHLPLLQPTDTPLAEMQAATKGLLEVLAEGCVDAVLDKMYVADRFLYGQLFLRSLQSLVFSPEAKNSILPSAIARYFVAIEYAGLDDEDYASLSDEQLALRPIEELGRHRIDPDIAVQLIGVLPDLDPLNPPQGATRLDKELRDLSRSIVAMALMTSLRLEGKDLHLFDFFESRKIELPENGFTQAAFLEVLDSTLRIRGGFAKEAEAIKQDFLDNLKNKTGSAKPGEGEPNTPN